MRSNSEVLRACCPRRFEVGYFMEDNPCAICGNRRELHTSWTPVNPGRRFLACPNDECKDFAWFDPPKCERSGQIIPGLLRVRNNMEKEILARKKKERMLWIALGTSQVLFVILFLFSEKV